MTIAKKIFFLNPPSFLLKIFFYLYLLIFKCLFSVSLDYIFEFSGGLNFSIANHEAIKTHLNLEKIEKTVAGTFHIKNGVVVFDRLLLLLSYDFFERESYLYKTSYFILNQSSLLERKYHSLQLNVGYSFFPYSNKNNISLSLGGGWVRKIHSFFYLNNVSGIPNINNATLGPPTILHYDEGILSTELKFYHRLRKESTLFLGVEYSLLLPSLEHFPSIVLGIDLNLEIIPPDPIPSPETDDQETNTDNNKKN